MATTPERLVVVGASLAGLRAAEAARAAGHQGTVTLVGAEPHLPYDRPPLSKALLEPGAASEVRPLNGAADLAAAPDVTTFLGTPASRLDPERRLVHVGDDAVEYDALVVATGSRPVMLPDADELAGVHALRTHEDAVAVRRGLDAGARVVVIGGGFIGSEVASAARKRGLTATVVEREPGLLARSLGPEPGAICAGLHRDAGTGLRLGVGVAGLHGDGSDRVCGVELEDGSLLDADLVVVGVGVRPNTQWLEDSGIALHQGDRGIIGTPTLATSLPGVWAAGDVVHFPNRLFDGEIQRLEHWTSAAEQGTLAARNALGLNALGVADEQAELATVPYFWSDWYGHRLQFVGTPKADEVRVVGPAGPGALVLYRRGPRLVGTFTVNRPREIMKFRRRILEPAGWLAALADAEERVAAAAAVG